MPDGFRITRLAGVTARLVAHDWPFARDHAAEIAEHWQARRARSPGMFDGTVLLARAWSVADGIARVDLFAARYSSFIAYRDRGRTEAGVVNAFAAIVPGSLDGGVLLGAMGTHTANAGQLYFPCGTPDLDDVRGETVDLAGSAARELTEETGLALPADAATDWVLLAGEGQLAFLRPVRFPETADALCARIEAHRRREAEPELAGIHVARAADGPEATRMPGFVRAYLADVFGV